MEIIEIPFGAKDSELQEWTYTIPKGMKAEIRDGKVIIKRKESRDERIRKAIVALIEDLQQSDKNFADVELTDMLAWLEKQKINTEGDFGRGYDCGYEACLNSYGAEFFEKQKEQKPRWEINNPYTTKWTKEMIDEKFEKLVEEFNPEWSEEDKPVDLEKFIEKAQRVLYSSNPDDYIKLVKELAELRRR